MKKSVATLLGLFAFVKAEAQTLPLGPDMKPKGFGAGATITPVDAALKKNHYMYEVKGKKGQYARIVAENKNSGDTTKITRDEIVGGFAMIPDVKTTPSDTSYLTIINIRKNADGITYVEKEKHRYVDGNFNAASKPKPIKYSEALQDLVIGVFGHQVRVQDHIRYK